MILTRLRIRDFRNYTRLDAGFSQGFHVLLGDNAQGKTNVLEAIYLLATLRSFRGVGSAQLVRHGQTGYFVGAGLRSQHDHDIKLYWSAQERRLSVDSQPIRRISQYLGVLRAVVFCSEDLQLIKGTPRQRRRFIDLLLCQTHPSYLALLHRYALALRSRNALLKQRVLDEGSLESFSLELIAAGTQILAFRREFVPRIAPLMRAACRQVAGDTEELRVHYVPGVKRDFALELAQSRAREKAYRSTVVGPHKDDLVLELNDKPAAQFASEGQKRTLAIALKMAQAEYLSSILGVPPVLLIDDVMGELDAKRRSGLLPLLERSHQARGQVFMTCTQENWPRELGRDLLRWTVKAGNLWPG